MAGTTSLKLPEDLKRKVTDVAQGVAQSPHAYMVEAITEKVARDEKQREFVAAAERSRAKFKRTGVVYAHGDVLRWCTDQVAAKEGRKPKPIRIPKSER